MPFQVPPQIAFLRGCIATLVAFVWLFSTVGIQMCPQIACLIAYIIALVAFILFFPTMSFQMSPQRVYARGCIVGLGEISDFKIKTRPLDLDRKFNFKTGILSSCLQDMWGRAR